MATKTVRVLRTLPLAGVIYRANDLLDLTDEQQKSVPATAVDGNKAAVDYCKSIGVKPVKPGVDPRAKPAAPAKPAADADDEGEITE